MEILYNWIYPIVSTVAISVIIIALIIIYIYRKGIDAQ